VQATLLTDDEARNVLSRLVEGFAARNPDFPIADDKALANIITTIGQTEGEAVLPRRDSELTDQRKAERKLLVLLSQIPEQREFVEGAIALSRKVLLEPITTALVMAGIILVLQTQFDVRIKQKNGKSEYEVHVGKKPTDKSLLTKFFSLFS
jgi:hypothetical protein